MSLLGKGNFNSFTDIEVPVMEGYDVETAGDAYAHQEFIQDMVSVYEAMHTADMAEIEVRKNNGGVALESCTTGLEEFEAVTESAFGDVAKRLKAALEKLWAKIKGFFKSIRKYFDYIVMNSKDFAKKYQVEIVKAVARADSDFELEMYNYDDNKIGTIESQDFYKEAKSIINGKGGNIANLDADGLDKEIYTKLRAKLTGGKGVKEDFSEEISKCFRNGVDSTDKVKVEPSKIQGFVKILMEDKCLKQLASLENKMNKAFAEQIKEINTDLKERASEENTAAVKVATKKVTAFEGCQAIINTFIRAWQGVVKERSSAYKSACMKIMSYRPKNK